MSAPPPLDLERSLNPEQIAAVTHGSGPQLVLAGAGSGKTRVITYRIAWLVREMEVEPWRIAAVTFTNKAAREMAERVEHLVGARTEVFVGTFHRFALRLLRRYGERIGVPRDFSILDTTDQRALVKEALAAENLAETAFPVRAVLARISAAKNRLLDPDAFEADADGFFEHKIAPVYRRYQGLLARVGGVDFDDLICGAVRLLEDEQDLGDRMRRRLRHLLVDEFQDTNHAQLQLIHALAGDGGNLTAVGDEDQSIYRWRGAELENILRFERSFPGAEVRKLERNYRSTQTILEAASDLVARNELRRGKRLWTEGDEGDLIEVYRAADEHDEARWLVSSLRQLRDEYRWRDMGVLVRTNAQTRSLEEELLRQQVPYHLIAGVRFYDRAEVKDIVAYLRVLRNPRDSHSLRRILNKPTRGIGKATQEVVFTEAEEMGGAIWDVLRYERFGSLSQRASNALCRFRDLILDLRRRAVEVDLPTLLEAVLEDTGYLEQFNKNDPDAESRLENLKEFLSAAYDFVEESGWGDNPALTLSRLGSASPEESADVVQPGLFRPDEEPPGERGDELLRLDDDDDRGSTGEDSLTSFLDYVSLVSDTDGLDTELGVSLMTLHAAKGLEFPVIAVTGLEDGLLPHFNSQDTPEDLEEERRLLYVGMTRAQRRLLLTTCRRRRVAGRYQDQLPSPFLSELPERLVQVHDSPSLFDSGRTAGVRSFFGRAEPEPAIEDPMLGELRKGCQVRHATLGKGVVLDLEGEGDDAKLTVFFQSAGKRKLLARYASLEVD